MSKKNKFGMFDGKMCTYGGSALIEGVMMKGPNAVAIAVRKPDGDIAVIKKPADKKGTRKKISKIPFVRGAYGIFDSMVDGVRYLMKSAEFTDLYEEETQKEPGKFEKFLERKFGDKLLNIILYFSVFFSLLLGIGFFMLLPKFVVELFGINDNRNILKNIIEGLIRLTLFLVYIILASRLNDIKRVFAYHGAEHKAIHCLEHDEELTVENVRKYTTLHPRCGTAFLFLVMLISIFLYSLLDYLLISINLNNFALKILSRLLFMPLLAGISYEVTRLATRSKLKIVKLLNYPGLMLQYFTTKEPADAMIEVSIASLKAVMDESFPFTTEEEEKSMIEESQNYSKRKSAAKA